MVDFCDKIEKLNSWKLVSCPMKDFKTYIEARDGFTFPVAKKDFHKLFAKFYHETGDL